MYVVFRDNSLRAVAGKRFYITRTSKNRNLRQELKQKPWRNLLGSFSEVCSAWFLT